MSATPIRIPSEADEDVERVLFHSSDIAECPSFQIYPLHPTNPFIRQAKFSWYRVHQTAPNSTIHSHLPSSHMLNLANANTLMRLAIDTFTPQTCDPAEDTRSISPDSSPIQPQTAPLSNPGLQFGPIWLREAQQAAASCPTSPADQNAPQSSPTGTAALKEIFCQPPTPEMHRDSLRHAFLSLSSGF